MSAVWLNHQPDFDSWEMRLYLSFTQAFTSAASLNYFVKQIMHHQGIFHVPGSQNEINRLVEIIK